MNAPGIRRLLLVGVLATLLGFESRASDHADPMSLNVFEVQGNPEANITDLHAFVVDGAGMPASDDPFTGDHRLIISLCVRRALRPDQTKGLDLEPYTFRIHIDLSPPVRFVEKTASRGKTGAALEAAHQDLSMQALYGGIITNPEDISETAVLEFDLRLAYPDMPPYVVLEGQRAWGFLGPVSLKALDRTLQGTEVVTKQPGVGEIGVTAGLFDDPFIFPRFFRRNVVGVVASIPIRNLMRTPKTNEAPILIWATTHKGNQQIDHVGRSLRTQLPRFGHLNVERPSDQVRAITRVHAEPTITEALLGTIVSPLFAHRHYDSVPDVMIYDLRKPARFPNGRWLEDDVAKTLAEAGETLLLELAYSESREFPRASINDKEFRTATHASTPFPYLADPWTPEGIEKKKKAGSPLREPDPTADAQITGSAGPPPSVPRAADAAAIAQPTLDNSIWRRLFWYEVAAIIALTLAMVFTVRSPRWRLGYVAAAFLTVIILLAVPLENLTGPAPAALQQPMMKLQRLAIGLALIVLLVFGWLYALGRRFAPGPAGSGPGFPRGRQGPIADDARTRSFAEIHSALFDPSVSRPYYKLWGDPVETRLPLYKTTFASITKGLFSLRAEPFEMVKAARRTLQTRGDLRWGADRNGFRRLVHPMGVCLEGTWKIDSEPRDQKRPYTGYFAVNKQGRVIARYSLGGNQPRGGHYRSLGLVGKLFPPGDTSDGDTPRAHFITQEDLGGAFTNSVRAAILTNSPPVRVLKRGSGIFAFFWVIVALIRADTEPSERQLYEIAELDKPDRVPTVCPRFMRLTIQGMGSAVGDERIDFRDEILGMIYDPRDPRQKRSLDFAIEISDKGHRTLFQRVVGQEWTRIGILSFQEAMASYNGDFVVHFHHPVWRRDRNDPKSVQRRALRS